MDNDGQNQVINRNARSLDFDQRRRVREGSATWTDRFPK
jgi:hypothetical protein